MVLMLLFLLPLNELNLICTHFLITGLIKSILNRSSRVMIAIIYGLLILCRELRYVAHTYRSSPAWQKVLHLPQMGTEVQSSYGICSS